MQGEINMDLSFCQAENGYSLDELVQKLANCFEQDAAAKSNKAGFRMDREKDGIRNFELATRLVRA